MPEAPTMLPANLQQITSPLKLNYWQEQLGTHPNQEFTQLVQKDITHCFKIGFQHTTAMLKAKKGNILSTMSHPQVVSEYIAEVLKLGRIAKVCENVGLPVECMGPLHSWAWN